MAATIVRLSANLPFEKDFFEQRGVPAAYLGHPLATVIRPSMTRAEFCTTVGILESLPIVALLPGSRHG